MAGSTRTSKTAGEDRDEAAGVTGVGEAPDSETTDTKSASSSESSENKKTTLAFVGRPSLVTRRISAKDFKAAGVEGMKDQEWSEGNQHEVDVSEWPQEAIDFVLKQPNFKLV